MFCKKQEQQKNQLVTSVYIAQAILCRVRKMMAVGFVVLMVFPCLSLASLPIPHTLNGSEQRTAAEILGYTTMPKILGNPYALGGYDGVEIGYSFEVIRTDELSRLGSKTKTQTETSYSVLNFGKGLYNNVDVFVQLTPFTQEESVSNFGGQLRWGFYQADYLPISLSLNMSANTTNFQNLIVTNSQGYDLIASVGAQDLTLYTGIGQARTVAQFVGGTDGVTETHETSIIDIHQLHYLAGLNIKLQSIFLALQLDRHTQETYSAKLGVRF